MGIYSVYLVKGREVAETIVAKLGCTKLCDKAFVKLALWLSSLPDVDKCQ